MNRDEREARWMQAHLVDAPQPPPLWFERLGLFLCVVLAVLVVLAIATDAGLIR